MKRSIHWILIITLLVSLFSVPAYADEAEAGDQPPASETETSDTTETPPEDTSSSDVPPDETTEPSTNEQSVASDPPPGAAQQSTVVQQEAPQTIPFAITELQVDGVCQSSSECTPGSNVEFIELYNPNEVVVSLNGWKLLRQATGSSSQPQTLEEFGDIGLSGKEHAIITLGLQEPNEQIIATYSEALSNTAGSLLLQDPSDTIVDTLGWGSSAKSYIGQAATAPPTDQSIQRCLNDGALYEAQPRSNREEFLIYEDLGPTPGAGIECVPPPIVNICPGLVISEIGANTETQFIELYNTSDQAIDSNGCKLQTNRSSTQFSLSETMAPGSFRVISISSTPLTLTKTTSGTVYLLSSDGATELQSVNYSNLAEETSWAWFGGNDWRQTYVVTAGSPNSYQQYISCEVGYERNPATGRCNKIDIASALSLCREGQYRSEETNRCRSIASAAASVLKPCEDDQFRNPATNRCKKIASADELSDCGEGRERNPTTNRCRNVVFSDVPAAAFAVEPVKDGATAFAGWWALGGIATVALGYAGWEWRREISSILQKATAFLGPKV